MASIYAFTFVFGNKRITIDGKSFLDGVKFILNQIEKNQNEPLKVTFPKSEEILYFDKTIFTAFAKGEITKVELVEKTSCNGLFRNKEAIVYQNGELDPGTLFVLKNDKLILVDSDQYFAIVAPDDNFYEV